MKRGPEYHGRCSLYRLYDADDRLLYVGIGANPKKRWNGHKADKIWWSEVTRKTVTWFDSRAEARAVETEAIRTEKPMFDQSQRRDHQFYEEASAYEQAVRDRAAQKIEDDIRAGVYRPNEVLPDLRLLQRRYSLTHLAASIALTDLERRKVIANVSGYVIVHDPDTFPRDLHRRYGIVYALGVQTFGYEPFTAVEMHRRTRLHLGFLEREIAELGREGLAKQVDRDQRAAEWVLLEPPPPPPLPPPPPRWNDSDVGPF
jgi:predicted GIY-YIG superfamily endonuclease